MYVSNIIYVCMYACMNVCMDVCIQNELGRIFFNDADRYTDTDTHITCIFIKYRHQQPINNKEGVRDTNNKH